VKAKGKLTHYENRKKMRCHANKGYCATHCKPETRKREIAATLVFVCTGHYTFNR